MTSVRSYQQFCPIAATLNAVGDRWALLVVRDLLLGPRRFVDMQRGLGGVSTDILAARLRELESNGIVRRTEVPARGYELTDAGKRLRPVLVELARWGSDRLELPTNIDDVAPHLAFTSILLDMAPLPSSVRGRYELHSAGESVRVAVADGQVTIAEREADVDTHIDFTHRGLIDILLGGSVRPLLKSGDVTVRGDVWDAIRFLDGVTASRGTAGSGGAHGRPTKPEPLRRSDPPHQAAQPPSRPVV